MSEEKEVSFQLLKINNHFSFSFFFDFSQFLSLSSRQVPSYSVFSREKRYQRFRCHCNEVLLKNAQLYNEINCCIAALITPDQTNSQLDFLLSKNEILSSIFKAFSLRLLKFFSIFPDGKISKNIQKSSRKSSKWSQEVSI